MAQKVAGNIVIRLSTGDGADQYTQAMQKAAASTRAFGGVTRGMGSDMQRSSGLMRVMSRDAAEFAGIMFIGGKAIAAQTTATGALEASINRLRAARIGLAAATGGLTGALTVGTEVAAVVAIERIAESAYRRAKEIEATSLSAQKRGFSYEDTTALQFAAQRISKPPDYFDSAVKSAGGVKQLADRLKELGEIQDPLVRAQTAFKEFGQNADKVLENVGVRFGENIERAKEWGFTLDEVSRTKIVMFSRDITALKGMFDSLSDSVAASRKNFVSLLEMDFAGIWELLTRGPGTLLSAVKPNIAFSADTLDTKEAQRGIQQRQSQDMIAAAQQEMLRSLTAPAEKKFTKDFLARDQEADLRAEIADLRKRLFVSDRTSPDFGKLTSGASFPGGYGAQAESLQKLTSDQDRLARVLEAKKAIKDADEAAKKAARELEAAQRSVAAALQAAQLAELSGADRLRAEREIAIGQYGKTKQLISDITKEFDSKFYVEGRNIIAQSAADMTARAEAEARLQESQLNARTKYASDAILNTIKIRGEAPAKRDEVAMQGADIGREAQLRQLENFSAKTLTQKAAVEAAKFQIESAYFIRIQEIEAQGVDRGYQKQLQDLKVLVDAKLITEKAYDDQKRALDENEQLDLLKLHERTDAEIQKSGIAAAKATREAYQQEFAKIQQAMDQVLGRFSDQLANLVTGQKTSFGKMFQDMGHTLTSNAIKGGLQMLLAPLERRAVGQQGSGIPGTGQVGDTLPNGDTLAGVGAPRRGLGGILPGLLGLGKKDGSTASNALWVQMADTLPGPGSAGQPAAPGGASGGFAGLLQKLLGFGKPAASPSILNGNGGLLGTGTVPTAGGSSVPGAAPGDASAPFDPHRGWFVPRDQYGFRVRPENVPVTPPVPVGQSLETGKPDGTSSNPFYVVSDSDRKNGSALSRALGTAGGALGGIGAIFGGGAGSGGGDTPDVSSTISYPGLATGGPVKRGNNYLVGEKGPEWFTSEKDGHIVDHETTKRLAKAGMLPNGVKGGILPSASPKPLHARALGGDVSASNAYLVGERGPEILTGASGRIASNSESRRMLNSPGAGASYYIDARGTDPHQTEQRVKSALVAVHGSAISSSVQSVGDRARRTPASRH
jgi:hypothetical protein